MPRARTMLGLAGSCWTRPRAFSATSCRCAPGAVGGMPSWCRSHWHEAQASAAVFTEEQLQIHVLERASADHYLEPEFALHAEGQALSEAGWACYEPIDIPAEGACYNDLGILWEDTDRTS